MMANGATPLGSQMPGPVTDGCRRRTAWARSVISGSDDTAPSELITLLASWRRHLAGQRMSPSILVSHSAAVRGFDRFPVDHRLPTVVLDVRREHVDAFITALLETSAPATAHNRHRGLHGFFGWLVDEGEIEASDAGLLLAARRDVTESEPAWPDPTDRRRAGRASGRRRSVIGKRLRDVSPSRRRSRSPVGKVQQAMAEGASVLGGRWSMYVDLTPFVVLFVGLIVGAVVLLARGPSARSRANTGAGEASREEQTPLRSAGPSPRRAARSSCRTSSWDRSRRRHRGSRVASA